MTRRQNSGILQAITLCQNKENGLEKPLKRRIFSCLAILRIVTRPSCISARTHLNGPHQRTAEVRSETCVLVYGGGSIKKNGIYDEVISNPEGHAAKRWWRMAGVMPNPTVEKLYEGCRRCQGRHKADLIAGGRRRLGVRLRQGGFRVR